jgi:hypothetical protein
MLNINVNFDMFMMKRAPQAQNKMASIKKVITVSLLGLAIFHLCSRGYSVTAVQGANNHRWIRTEEKILIPKIEGKWWTIAGNPDLGHYTSKEQEPTAFGIWKAADGTWQLFSCIRYTNCGGKTRLFYRWQSDKITDENWKTMGIVMEADENFGETLGGLQSPHATRIGREYLLVYGDWENICLAKSQDGKTFARQLNLDGLSGMFSEGMGAGTRDPMITVIGNTYYLYYTSFPDEKCAIYCRTSKDLCHWSETRIVSSGGSAGSGPFDAEVPCVLYLQKERSYYLFRTHSSPDSDKFMTTVYRSRDPLDFGIDNDRYKIATLPTESTWIINDNGQYYIAALLPNHQGTRMARLKWVYQ